VTSLGVGMALYPHNILITSLGLFSSRGCEGIDHVHFAPHLFPSAQGSAWHGIGTCCS
jgi:hypothetical protein